MTTPTPLAPDPPIPDLLAAIADALAVPSFQFSAIADALQAVSFRLQQQGRCIPSIEVERIAEMAGDAGAREAAGEAGPHDRLVLTAALRMAIRAVADRIDTGR